MIDVTIKVHKHYINTKMRFWCNGDTYVEFSVGTHEFPARMLTAESRRDLWAICDAHVMDKPTDFPTFPYPAYLEVCLRFDDKHVCSVQSARYSEFQRGTMDFTNAFANSLVSYELQMKVLTRLAELIKERNAEELNKMILTLRAASGGAFKKLS